MKLEQSFSAAINKVSRENKSNTPDFILADFLCSCLKALETAINEREKWYGIKMDIGKDYEEIVFKAIGAASMCWSKIDKVGVFDSTKAKAIAEELIKDLRK